MFRQQPAPTPTRAMPTPLDGSPRRPDIYGDPEPAGVYVGGHFFGRFLLSFRFDLTDSQEQVPAPNPFTWVDLIRCFEFRAAQRMAA